MHIFVFHRKGQVNGLTSVVLTLVFHSNDSAVCHFFFVFLHFGALAYVDREPTTLYYDIVLLLNQDTMSVEI